MSSRTTIKLFTLLCTGLLLGCTDETVVGTSGEIDVALPQATLGAFAYDSSTAIADVNGDGTDDLVVWTNAARVPDELISETPPIPPVGVFVFFGGSDGFGRLGPADADVTLRLPERYTFVGRVATQDLDSDGSAELVVHLAVESSPHFWPMPVPAYVYSGGPETGVYIVNGASLAPGTHELVTVGQHTPAYAFASEYMVQATHALRDLDGVPGEEFLTESYRLAETGTTTINVRDLATGETRARLLAPENTFLDVRGVLDHDGDGQNDVIALFVKTSGLNPNRWTAWDDVGYAVFYGPLEGDVVLGDEGTMQAAYFGSIVSSGPPSVVLGGAARSVTGQFCGDETEDLLLVAVESSENIYCVQGGSRDGGLPRQGYGALRLRLSGLDWAIVVPRSGDDPSRIFVMGSDLFAFLTPEVRTIVPDAFREQELINSAGLSYDMPNDSPLFTTLGGAMGDLDGDGTLDLALGTKARELEAESMVHVIYGFGG